MDKEQKLFAEKWNQSTPLTLKQLQQNSQDSHQLENELIAHYEKVESEVDATFKELQDLLTKKHILLKSEIMKQKNTQLIALENFQEQLKKETAILESENSLLQIAIKTASISVLDWNKLYNQVQISEREYPSSILNGLGLLTNRKKNGLRKSGVFLIATFQILRFLSLSLLLKRV
jgi:hypothetical protein